MSEHARVAAFFQDATAYEHLMGRWSRRLAPSLIQFGGVADGERVLDAGCGTGCLSLAFPGFANFASITGIDITETYIAAARDSSTDPRVTFEVGDVCALPYPDSAFDRAYSSLVLHFLPDAARAVVEMLRVVRPGGVVTAAVWDNYGGQLFTRIMWDVAGVLDPDLERPYFRPLNGPGELAAMWRASGFTDVEDTSLLIRMDYPDFNDYWSSFTAGEGPHGKYVMELPASSREKLEHHVRRAFLGNRPDGPRSMMAVAWACRGRVPG